MRSITMTAEQTAAYDREDRALMAMLITQAKQLANETGETVEIYTADGILADYRTPDRSAPPDIDVLDAAPGGPSQVWGGWIWMDGFHEFAWSMGATREACEEAVRQAIALHGIDVLTVDEGDEADE